MVACLIDRSVEDPASAVARADAWESIMVDLSPRHRRTVERHCRDGRNFVEIGAELGVTASRVCQLFAEAVAILRSAGKVTILLGTN